MGMRKNKKTKLTKEEEIQQWFKKSVVYEGEAYLIDLEQAKAIIDNTLNTIVVARAGSGKTRTLVAKIVYLIARCNLKPEEILVFVFNTNAAIEINERLNKMMVDGKLIIENAKIASTFHAFSRKIVYEVCGGKKHCGKILAEEKEKYINMVTREIASRMSDDELSALSKQMTSFVNRAQQQFLNSKDSLIKKINERLARDDLMENEKSFIEIGAEVYRRYHWYLLRKKKYMPDYGTDFNLLVSWASKLIFDKKTKSKMILENKKYILVDEYQDFSQLFLSAILAIRKIAKDVKLFVVGDDWQAINRFAGSEVKYFKNFEKYFNGECRKLEMTTNYRCDYEIVEVARKFMKKSMNEEGRLQASSRESGEVILVNPRKTYLEFTTVEYDKRTNTEDKIYQIITKKILGRMPKKSTVRYLKTIVKIIKNNWKAKDILILHRNNETNLEGIKLGDFGWGLKKAMAQLYFVDERDFDEKIRLMTIHKSKGLEAEVVIILEVDDGVIPKKHPDANLYGLFGESDEVSLEDQKRLFYVAITRAKRRLYIIHNGDNRDGFIKYLGKKPVKWQE